MTPATSLASIDHEEHDMADLRTTATPTSAALFGASGALVATALTAALRLVLQRRSGTQERAS